MWTHRGCGKGALHSHCNKTFETGKEIDRGNVVD
jgi:hypothetical protein